jgi:tail tube protein
MPGRPTNEPSNYWSFGFQSAKDIEASTFQFLRHLDGTGNDVEEDVESVREGGDGQEIGLRYKTAIAMDGQAVANARPEIGFRLAAAALGADVGVVASTAPPALASVASGVANLHTAVPTSAIPYLTIEQFWADVVERVPNCQVTGLDIEWEAGRPLKLTPKFIGGGTNYNRPAASALTPVRESGPPFFYPGASVVLDGAANTKSTKGKISINRGVDDAIRTTGLNREDVVALNFDVTVDATLKYEDQGLYAKTHVGASGGTQVPIDLATSAIRITSYLGQGTGIRMFEVGVNQFHLTGARVNRLDPDGKTMYIDVAGMGYKGATYQAYVRAVIGSVAAIV